MGRRDLTCTIVLEIQFNISTIIGSLWPYVDNWNGLLVEFFLLDFKVL